MATHGRTGLPHLLFGSVAEALLSQSPVPVLLVNARPGEAVTGDFSPTRAKVVIALDGSTFAEAALEPAADLVGTTGDLILVYVIVPPTTVQYDETGRVIAYLDQQEEARTRDARDYLVGVAKQLEQCHPGMRIRTEVRLGEPANGINMIAVDRNADLVVMATHGRTGLSRALVGSVAGAVLRDANTPVLLVGPHEAHVAERVLSTHAATA
jgi:nucleotide-binding universal stress UspA family protein